MKGQGSAAAPENLRIVPLFAAKQFSEKSKNFTGGEHGTLGKADVIDQRED
jgi:hypothetical protein